MPWRLLVRKEKEIKKLLTILFDEDLHDKWLNGHNLKFGMTPQEMIDSGREEEVLSYLDYSVYGPY
jgi:hypothetical protein